MALIGRQLEREKSTLAADEPAILQLSKKMIEENDDERPNFRALKKNIQSLQKSAETDLEKAFVKALRHQYDLLKVDADSKLAESVCLRTITLIHNYQKGNAEEKLRELKSYEIACVKLPGWKKFGLAIAAILIAGAGAILGAAIGISAGAIVGFLGGPGGGAVGALIGLAKGSVTGLGIGLAVATAATGVGAGVLGGYLLFKPNQLTAASSAVIEAGRKVANKKD